MEQSIDRRQIFFYPPLVLGKIAACEAGCSNWRGAFENEWWTLEQVYAVALDRKKTTFSFEDEALIQEAIGKLRTLVGDALSQLERAIS